MAFSSSYPSPSSTAATSGFNFMSTDPSGSTGKGQYINDVTPLVGSKDFVTKVFS